MINLPNPFESALAPAMAADAAAAPGLTDPPVAAAVNFDRTCAENAQVAESSRARGGQEAPAEATQNPATAGLLTREDYIPELFSSFARRRCMHIVNPPLRQQCRREFQLDEAAFFDAILPPEPPPLFLRSPSEKFMRALFELGH